MATAMGIHWVKRIQLLLFAAAIVLAVGACSREHSTKTQADSSTQSGSQEIPLDPAGYGGERGNGAEDHLYTEDRAWFADENRTIQFCVEYDASFGVDEAKARESAAAALNRWHAYLLSKADEKENPIELAKKSVLLASCNGQQDLTFYFGKKPEGIEREIYGHDRIWAYSKLLSYDIKTRWGKGYIWLRNAHEIDDWNQRFPNWEVDNSLDIVLTHEVGHAHGMNHIAGTIMDDKIVIRAKTAYMERPESRKKLVEIDQTTELIIGARDSRYEGVLGGIAKDKSREIKLTNYTKLNFERLVGRKPNGPVTAYVEADYESIKKLVIQDTSGKYEFLLTAVQDSWTVGREEEAIFKVQTGITEYNVSKVRRVSEMLTLKTASGERLSISANRNLYSPDFHVALELDTIRTDRLSLRIIEGEAATPLFFSTY